MIPRFPFHIFLFLSFLSVNLIAAQNNGVGNFTTSFNVGVVLDMDSPNGRIGWSCISMALDDFYAAHTDYSTRLVLQLRNSSRGVVGAGFAALDLLRNAEVRAIIGPQKSSQADFVMNLGDQAHVPTISFSATSPSLSKRTPYFVRTAQDDSAQVKSIAEIIHAFRWREVVLIYEDTEYGHGVIPYLVDALLEIEARVTTRTLISLEATDYEIHEELHKLKNMYNRVLVVHMTQSIGSRFFLKAKEAGMMSNGYAWIVTDGTTALVDFMDSKVIAAMQGVLGVRPYVPRSNALDDFKIRWNKKFRQENPDLDRAELNFFGLWAYDTAWMLAMAVERIGLTTLATNTSIIAFNSTNFASINSSPIGENLLKLILNTRFQGLSGDFQLINGQLQSSIFQIVNVIGRGVRQVGFWSTKHGISQDLDVSSSETMTSTTNFRGIIWPGETTTVPKGWVIPTSGKKLKIAVPYTRFTDFVKVDHDTRTNTTTIKGYSIDIFKAVVDSLPYALPYEFVPFEIRKGFNTYDDVIYQVFLQKFDAVVGTTSITANRSLYVDFTLPYTNGGVSMLVPIKFDVVKSAWFFLEPLTKELWFTTLAFFIFTGLVVWVLEHRINKAFRGPLSQHLGMILWFPFSTLVFAHRERVVSNLTRVVVLVWLFFVLILTSTYTASLSSILTVDSLQQAVPSVLDLIENGDYVGCKQGGFILDMLKGMKFDKSKIKSFDTIEECDKALLKGSQNGGISAFFDTTPYIKRILAKYCDKYMEVGGVNNTDGFGFIFSRGSPLVGDISRAILNVTQGDKMIEINRTWGHQASSCSEPKKKSKSLRLYNFRGLFIITGIVSFLALLIFLGIFLYNNGYILTTPIPDHDTFWKRCEALLKKFDAKDPAFEDVNLMLRILRKFVEEIQAAVPPVPDVSVAPVPDVPVAPVPDVPVAPVPDVPVAPVPDVPVAPVPDVPVAVIQRADVSVVVMPDAVMPDTVIEDATAPVLDVPVVITPAEDMPDMPAVVVTDERSTVIDVTLVPDVSSGTNIRQRNCTRPSSSSPPIPVQTSSGMTRSSSDQIHPKAG